jgi:hypothetical protein
MLAIPEPFLMIPAYYLQREIAIGVANINAFFATFTIPERH